MENLRKFLGGRLVLDNISFVVDEGEAFCLLGPNGAGKTTTVRVLLGIYRPDSGRVMVKGLDVHENLSEVKRVIGYLPETPSLYDRLTVYRNLEFYGHLFDIRGGELDSRIREVSRLLGIEDRLNELVGRLSKGLRQRVAIARAILNNPEILILDQPTSDLDPGMAHSIRSTIRELNTDGGLTLIVCTHNLQEAEFICSKVAIINRGRVVGYGDIKELKRRLVKIHKFHIETLDPIRNKVHLFSELDYVIGAEVTSDYSVIVSLNRKDLISDLITLMISRGLRIFEVRYVEPSLEDVYLDLVGGHGEA